MNLTLKRGDGYFILDDVALSLDTIIDSPYGHIDFTSRSTAQKRMLASYDPDAVTFTGAVIYSATTI